MEIVLFVDLKVLLDYFSNSSRFALSYQVGKFSKSCHFQVVSI